MNKKDAFKLFASKHPELVSYVSSGDMSWQKFYEIYDIYGESEDAWSSYFHQNTDNTVSSVGGLADKFKNFDMNSIQEHIKTAQKALNLVEELTTKSSENITNLASKGPQIPRPLNKFFED